jgi:hypothetical protein
VEHLDGCRCSCLVAGIGASTPLLLLYSLTDRLYMCACVVVYPFKMLKSIDNALSFLLLSRDFGKEKLETEKKKKKIVC